MRLYTEEPGAEQFARPVLDWRRKGRPLRRPYGKKRPLGISEGNDKLLQEVVRTILEKIYEPVFEESSHGFRPGRSPHTALEGIKQEWQAVKWLVDMDLRSYFDTINHDLLMGFLQKKIGDTRFLRLIKAMLDAGYLEDWTFHPTYSGVPQGSIVSPILANIYLHELDQFMKELKKQFDQGKKRKKYPPYHRLTERIRLLIPISVLRDHSKMREVSHRTEMLRVGFQLIESFTHLVNHGIKRGKSKISELFFA